MAHNSERRVHHDSVRTVEVDGMEVGPQLNFRTGQLSVAEEVVRDAGHVLVDDERDCGGRAPLTELDQRAVAAHVPPARLPAHGLDP